MLPGTRRFAQHGRWRQASDACELTGRVDLSAWPEGTRLICRRERPHPGAQLSFSDLDGHRFQCFITDQDGAELPALEARHRAHAIVEDRVRALNTMGLGNLPFAEFAANAAWLELELLAHDIVVWTQQLCLDGAHAVSEPKRLRYRILHVAGRLTRHARRLTLHLPADWPWKAALTRAFHASTLSPRSPDHGARIHLSPGPNTPAKRLLTNRG